MTFTPMQDFYIVWRRGAPDPWNYRMIGDDINQEAADVKRRIDTLQNVGPHGVVNPNLNAGVDTRWDEIQIILSKDERIMGETRPNTFYQHMHHLAKDGDLELPAFKEYAEEGVEALKVEEKPVVVDYDGDSPAEGMMPSTVDHRIRLHLQKKWHMPGFGTKDPRPCIVCLKTVKNPHRPTTVKCSEDECIKEYTRVYMRVRNPDSYVHKCGSKHIPVPPLEGVSFTAPENPPSPDGMDSRTAWERAFKLDGTETPADEEPKYKIEPAPRHLTRQTTPECP